MDGAHTTHLPQNDANDTQIEAIGLWSMDFCLGKRTAVLVAKEVADRG